MIEPIMRIAAASDQANVIDALVHVFSSDPAVCLSVEVGH